MARPRSEEKRLALLNAAAETVAEHGLAASPTSLIAKKAGVAEGTLFRYFPTKDDLLNELYLHLKQDMCEAMKKHYTATAASPLRERAQSLWNSYIDWGLAHPLANKAVNQLAVSSSLTPETLAKHRPCSRRPLPRQNSRGTRCSRDKRTSPMPSSSRLPIPRWPLPRGTPGKPKPTRPAASRPCGRCSMMIEPLSFFRPF